MKKTIVIALLTAVAFLTAPAARAQVMPVPHNEISVSYGVAVIGSMLRTNSNMVFRVMNILDPTFNTVVDTRGGWGYINLGYSYQFNKTVGVGITGGYMIGGIKMNLRDDTGSVTVAEGNLITIMNTGKFNWFRKPVFGMYSKVGLGVMIFPGKLVGDELLKKTFVLPTGQLSAVGMEVGNHFCGFLELGVGFQGIVQAGIRARF
jgi:opacity protein-like surface antigen